MVQGISENKEGEKMNNSVAKWEMDKHMAIEPYPMSLKKQQEYMKRQKEKEDAKK